MHAISVKRGGERERERETERQREREKERQRDRGKERKRDRENILRKWRGGSDVDETERGCRTDADSLYFRIQFQPEFERQSVLWARFGRIFIDWSA